MKRKIYISFLVVCVIFFVAFLYFELIMFPMKYSESVETISKKYNLEPPLVYAVIKTESDFQKDAKSSAGALGLMQILPSTARWIAEEKNESFINEDLFDEKRNIEYGCFYLRYLFDKFESIDVVVCAYNAGETKVRDWLLDGELIEEKIDYAETKNYLKKVRRNYQIYKNKELFR